MDEINYEELRKLIEALEEKEFTESDGVKKLLLILSQTTAILQTNTELINQTSRNLIGIAKDLDELKSSFQNECLSTRLKIKKLEEN